MSSRITDIELAMIISAAFVWFQVKGKGVDLSEVQKAIADSLLKVGVEVVNED